MKEYDFPLSLKIKVFLMRPDLFISLGRQAVRLGYLRIRVAIMEKRVAITEEQLKRERAKQIRLYKEKKTRSISKHITQ